MFRFLYPRYGSSNQHFPEEMLLYQIWAITTRSLVEDRLRPDVMLLAGRQSIADLKAQLGFV